MKRNGDHKDQDGNLKAFLRFLMATMLLLLSGVASFAQDTILDREVEFSGYSTTIKGFLDILSIMEEFTFSYGQYIQDSKRVFINAGKKTIREHLDSVFPEDSLRYVERGSKILIIPPDYKVVESSPYQTVRGRVIDIDSKLPLCGITVLLGSEGLPRGAITDSNGVFKFEKVRVGRHELKISSVGYESKVLMNLLVASGKEKVVTVELIESVIEIPEVNVNAAPERSKPVNDLTSVSGRSFSAYEIENFPGTMSDVSRVVQSFPGVLSSNDGQNHLVIRGNSPKGLLWRLEGIEIPNLNHFSDIGASGGGVGIISNNMIAYSDFLTGAFSAEYGNALSGVFDLRLRTGNNEKHEQSVQVGLIGTELMVEGPLSRESNATYIANYRYSTFKIIQTLGADLSSIPDFQDISFKLYLPGSKLGAFSIFGVGGLSHEEGENGYIMNSNMGTLGISNNYTIDKNTFLKSVLAFSAWNYNWFEEWNTGTDLSPANMRLNYDTRDYSLKLSLSINRKISKRHKLKAGVIFDRSFNNSFMGWFSDTLYSRYNDSSDPDYMNLVYEHEYVNDKYNASTIQSYLNWNFRLSEKFSLNAGFHFLQFYLNKNYSAEPRIGIKWSPFPDHIFSAGYGVHSRKESLTLYAGKKSLYDGTVIQPNIDLELTKARHLVLSYQYLLSQNTSIKAEAYYQYLFDVPAYPFPPYFSTINNDYGFEGNILVNYGTGYNRGIELTLERHFKDGYHFLLTGTLYESKYRNKLGELLDTKYNGSYASNGIIGKEFRVGKSKQNLLSLSLRYILIGGMRHLPIDMEQSLAYGYEVRLLDQGFSEKASDYFRIDLQLRYTINKQKHSSEWTLDIMNVTDRENELTEYWDRYARDFRIENQNPLIPMITYRIQF